MGNIKKPAQYLGISPSAVTNLRTNKIPYSAPTEDLVRKEIETLMEEYKKFDLSEYVDLFDGKTYGMFKYDYSFDRYVKPEIKKYCKE